MWIRQAVVARAAACACCICSQSMQFILVLAFSALAAAAACAFPLLQFTFFLLLPPSLLRPSPSPVPPSLSVPQALTAHGLCPARATRASTGALASLSRPCLQPTTRPRASSPLPITGSRP